MKRYLILENGAVMEGSAFGADGDVIAEIVFTTAMTGYVETLTDESYIGQAVCQTFPLIGNYGVNESDAEGEHIGVSAYLVREYSDVASNFRSQEDLETFLKKNGIPGLCGIDTRALTKMLREMGTMNGMITDDPARADMEKIKNYRIIDPITAISVKSIRHEPGPGPKIALYDFGKKKNILRSLLKRGCDVYILPHTTTAEEVLALKPDGIFLSNGPGDPADNKAVIEELKILIQHNIPTMGICLGHQLLALANGFSTAKLKYGHRGANHPVKSTETGKLYITSQNHGYAVVNESIDPALAKPWFLNINDGTNEGLLYQTIPAISVQFHPEACGGPNDTNFLFDRFLTMIHQQG